MKIALHSLRGIDMCKMELQFSKMWRLFDCSAVSVVSKSMSMMSLLLIASSRTGRHLIVHQEEQIFWV